MKYNIESAQYVGWSYIIIIIIKIIVIIIILEYILDIYIYIFNSCNLFCKNLHETQGSLSKFHDLDI